MKRPELVRKWKDQLYRAEVREYRFENGVRLVEAVNPSTIEFDIAVVAKAGNYFEHQLGVPDGTAHLLEHIVFGQPNKRHKTKKQLDNYLLGTKTRPSIYMNAAVSTKNMYFYGSSHKRGAIRLLKSLRYRLDFPLARSGKYIAEELEVITAEILGQKKEERDESFQSTKFLLKNVYPEYHYRRTGTVESVRQITAEHLVKYHRACFTSDRVAIAVQTGQKITPEQWLELNKIAELFPAPKVELEIKHYDIKDVFDFEHFQEKNNQAAFVSFCYFVPQNLKLDYKENVLTYLMNGAIRKVVFDKLRQEKQLIYSVSVVNSLINWHWRVRGFKLESDKENFLNVLDELFDLISTGFSEFLESREGQKWFVSRISDYIFPHNQSYSSDYGEQLAVDVLEENDYAFNNIQANQVARTVTIAELKQFIQENIQNRAPRLWLVSPFNDEEILELLRQSKWYKAYYVNQ